MSEIEMNLKPCPFCGGDVEIRKQKLPCSLFEEDYLICSTCGLRLNTLWGMTTIDDDCDEEEYRQRVVVWWNTRAEQREDEGAWVNGFCSRCNAPIPTDNKKDYMDEADNRYCYNCGIRTKPQSAEQTELEG